jgi:hypothetical protein
VEHFLNRLQERNASDECMHLFCFKLIKLFYISLLECLEKMFFFVLTFLQSGSRRSRCGWD